MNGSKCRSCHNFVFLVVIVPFVVWTSTAIGAASRPAQSISFGSVESSERLSQGYAGPVTLASGLTVRVSVSSDGDEGNDHSSILSLSFDGRYVAFVSQASNLVGGDDNYYCDTNYDYIKQENCPDIFVNDRNTGQTRRVSVATDGTQANNYSGYPSISADGRYVAFESLATNLVTNDFVRSCGDYHENCMDIFVHDLLNGETNLVSVSSDGVQANGTSDSPSISTDGRFVTFDSDASNLVEGDTNAMADIFVHDRLMGQTERVSVASDGAQGNADSHNCTISADGRFVVFHSVASNLVADDTNEVGDIFIHDRLTRQTSRVSVASDGSQANDLSWAFSISGDGRYVAFDSRASNLVGDPLYIGRDVYVHDRETGQTDIVSLTSDGAFGNNYSFHPAISNDGRYVAFKSRSSNFVDDDTNGFDDIFVHDRMTGITERVSVDTAGNQANSWSSFPAISGDGHFIAFYSEASNLVADDTNSKWDVFVHENSEELKPTETPPFTSVPSLTPTATLTFTPTLTPIPTKLSEVMNKVFLPILRR